MIRIIIRAARMKRILKKPPIWVCLRSIGVLSSWLWPSSYMSISGSLCLIVFELNMRIAAPSNMQEPITAV